MCVELQDSSLALLLAGHSELPRQSVPSCFRDARIPNTETSGTGHVSSRSRSRQLEEKQQIFQEEILVDLLMKEEIGVL